MASFTTSLGLILPVQGEYSGSWGDVVNNYLTTYVDSAVAGAQTLSADADVTLTKSTGAALGATSSQYAILLCTGARTAIRYINVPNASKIYIVINATTGGFSVTVRGSTGPTTGVTVANGGTAVLAWNGSDFADIGASTAGNRTINGNETVTGNLSVGGNVTSNLNITGSKLVMTTGAIQEHKSSIAASDIDLTTGNCFTKTISGTTTFTVSNVPSSGTVASFILDLTNGGSATINWWSGVKWPGGVAPSLTASGRDALGFYTYDGGTTWTGVLIGKDIK